ncbi:MAG: GNAT family N-acetyltransferase [Myxococcaceae bacterium]
MALSAVSEKPKKVRIQPFEPALRDQVFSLHATVFGARESQAFRARWRWSQVENLFPAQTPKWVLLDRDRVVGFVGTVPQLFRIGGRDVLTHTSSDFMVAPAYRFHGIQLMRACTEYCENHLSLDNVDATVAVLKFLRFAPVAVMRRYVKVLDGNFARARVAWGTRVPGIAWQPVNLLLRARDQLAVPRERCEAVALDDFDARFDRYFEKEVARCSAIQVRSCEYLRWRYGPASPHARRRLGVVVDSQNELSGYVITFLSGDAERSGYILELSTKNERNLEVTSALLRFAVRQLRSQGAWTVRLHQLDTGASIPASLLRAWNFQRREDTYQLLARLADPKAMLLAQNTRGWSMSFGDAEASHGLLNPI